MAGVIGAGVTLEGFNFSDFEFTYALSGTINKATDLGKAVSKDGTVANGLKLAADNDPIVGRLVSYEDRVQEGLKVGTVATKFIATLPIKDGETVAVGDCVVGAGAGEVKTLAVVANVALATTNTYTDAAVNTAINTAIAAINANIKARNNIVLQVVTRNSVNYAVVAFV